MQFKIGTMSAIAVASVLVTLLAHAAYGALLQDIEDNHQLAISNGTAPAWDVLMHIQTAYPKSSRTSSLFIPNTNDLETIIRSEVAGDWERGQFILELSNQAKTAEFKQAIYKALWQELQQTNQIYNPLRILNFYNQLKNHPDVPPGLLEVIYSTFIERSTQLLAAPFHTTSRTANFPLINSLLHRLTFSTLDYIRDIFDLLYDIVLALESPESVAQRLGNFTASLTQLTLANLQLFKRQEIANNTIAQEYVQNNLRQLLEEPKFETEVDKSLRQQLNEYLPQDVRIIYTARKICLRNSTDPTSYIYECPQTFLICSNPNDPKKAAYFVQRRHNNITSSLEVAFYSPYWSNRYILLESVPASTVAPLSSTSSPATQYNAIFKNVYSRSTIYWWHVVFENDGVVLYDSSNRNSVLCGGDPLHWEGNERHVYTRNGSEFNRYRSQCTWKVEDCSDVA